MDDPKIVDKMEAVWSSIAGLCATFGETEWRKPTDCPNWSVQDQLSHLVGSECRLLGRAPPDHTPQDTGHVKNDTGHKNEVLVDWRRSWPGGGVLEEFREVTGQRLLILRAMSAEDFAAETETPIGPGPVEQLIAIRIFDAWIHEQDIRRATAQPGHLDGPVAEHAMGRMAMALPYIVGRKVQPADGASVAFEITGPAGRVIPVGMDGTRANYLDPAPASPTVRLTMDVETFACLCCGRWEPGSVLNTGKVRIEGDKALGEGVVEQMNIMI